MLVSLFIQIVHMCLKIDQFICQTLGFIIENLLCLFALLLSENLPHQCSYCGDLQPSWVHTYLIIYAYVTRKTSMQASVVISNYIIPLHKLQRLLGSA